MTVTTTTLRQWQPEQLSRAGAELDEAAAVVRRQARDVADVVHAMVWVGTSATAARATADELGAGLQSLAEAVAVQGEALQRSAPVLRRAQDLLSEADRVAGGHGLRVLPDGSVTAPPPTVHAADLEPAALAAIAAAQRAAWEAHARAGSLARQAVASARECDADTAAALRAADGLGLLLGRVVPFLARLLGSGLPLASLALALREGLLGDISDRPLPAAGTDPVEVAAWWASLSPAAQQALLAAEAARLGSLDGLPARVRDQANRSVLADERVRLLAERDRLQRALDDRWFGGLLTDDDAALEHVRGKLDALDALDRTLALGGRSLLSLDLSGERATAAVAIGDVDTADHVAVFTPGLTSTVEGSLAGYDESMALLRRHASDIAARAGGSGTVATVTWLGYEAPQWGDTWRPTRSVVGDEAAQRGADRLSGFLRGLDAARPEPAHVTALGHSYGSLTTGLALQQGTGVDDAVFFGSPGLGTSDVRDLGLPSGHAFVVEARRDPVADLGRFGTDPNHLEGVTRLGADERVVGGERLSGSTGHSGYLTDDSTSQYAMAAVVAGRPELAPLDTSSRSGVGDLLTHPPGPGWLW